METIQFNSNVHTTVQSSAPLRGQALQDEGNGKQLSMKCIKHCSCRVIQVCGRLGALSAGVNTVFLAIMWPPSQQQCLRSSCENDKTCERVVTCCPRGKLVRSGGHSGYFALKIVVTVMNWADVSSRDPMMNARAIRRHGVLLSIQYVYMVITFFFPI